MESHFYLILPILLWLLARSGMWLVAISMIALLVRIGISAADGDVQYLSYSTIVGRIDQFVLGMLAGSSRLSLSRYGAAISAALVGFVFFYWLFDMAGGYYHRPAFPAGSAVWVIIPTIEGASYGLAISWYDAWCTGPPSRISRLVGRIGECSYSIYLLHFFWVFKCASFVNTQIMDISRFVVAVPWSAMCFMITAIPAYLCYRFVELPFLKFRLPYVMRDEATPRLSSTTLECGAS